jgi:hypothetical protein
MMARISGPHLRRDAAALRFLLLCLGGWAAMRVAMNWSPVEPMRVAVAPAAAPSINARSDRPLPAKDGVRARRRPVVATPAFVGAHPSEARARPFAVATPLRKPPLVIGRVTEGAADPVENDAAVRLAMPTAQPADAAAPRDSGFAGDLPSRAGWTLGGWLYLRGEAVDGLAAGGQIGGSQAGARLAYGFGEKGRTNAYGRTTVAVRRPRQRELAVGLAHGPFARLPIDVAVERRVAIGREGRDAFAAMVVGGVSEVALPAGFRLDAYAQAGVVGMRRRDGFADGALVVDRPLGIGALRIGALAAGAAQPDAACIDAGPRLTLGLPHMGKGARIALDWRQRVAGGARPGSGLALTLAGDF